MKCPSSSSGPGAAAAPPPRGPGSGGRAAPRHRRHRLLARLFVRPEGAGPRGRGSVNGRRGGGEGEKESGRGERPGGSGGSRCGDCPRLGGEVPPPVPAPFCGLGGGRRRRERGCPAAVSAADRAASGRAPPVRPRGPLLGVGRLRGRHGGGPALLWPGSGAPLPAVRREAPTPRPWPPRRARRGAERPHRRRCGPRRRVARRVALVEPRWGERGCGSRWQRCGAPAGGTVLSRPAAAAALPGEVADSKVAERLGARCLVPSKRRNGR